jgi:hypothetical protein
MFGIGLQEIIIILAVVGPLGVAAIVAVVLMAAKKGRDDLR